MSSSSNDHDDNHLDEQDEQEINAVVVQIQVLARAAGHGRHAVNRQRIANLLEATGPGQAALAAQLYWDDFLASSSFPNVGGGGRGGGGGGEPQDNMEQPQQHDDEEEEEEEEYQEQDEDMEMQDVQQQQQQQQQEETTTAAAKVPSLQRRRPMRSSLRRNNKSAARQAVGKRGKQQRHQDSNNENKDDDDDDDDDDLDNAIQGGVIGGSSRSSNNNPRRNNNNALPQKRRAPDPNVQRLVASAKATMQQVAREAPEKLQPAASTATTAETTTATTTSGGLLLSSEMTATKNSIFSLSANDWVWAAIDQEREKIPLTHPAAVLWGVTNDKDDNNDQEDEEDQEEEDTDTEKQASSQEKPVIPLTWLRVGLRLDEETALGLVLPDPTNHTTSTTTTSSDDNDFLAWEEWHQVALKRKKKNQSAPPFYCRATTAILSILTALLHANVQVQDDSSSTTRTSSNSCAATDHGGGGSSVRIRTNAYETAWTELSKQERQRQFDGRLTQALTCLLYRAAVVARTRRWQALQSMRPTEEEEADVNEAQRQRLRRKAAQQKVQRICPVLGWPATTTADGTAAEAAVHVPTAEQPTTYATSFTNLEDLHLYVASQLLHFQKPGGVALFLETLVQIHGPTTLLQMLNQVKAQERKASSQETNSTCGLIHCTCLQRDEEAHRPQATSTTMTTSTKRGARTNTQPEPKADCCGVEFISLILTGSIHTTWQNWSTDPLGVGILSDQAVLSKTLTRPLLPLWILVGPTVYSFLWTDPKQPDESKGPGTVVRLEHWNAWYQDRTSTQLRLSIGRYDWKPAHQEDVNLMDVDSDEKDAFYSQSYTLRTLEERRRKRCRIAEERQGLEVVDPNAVFTADERAQVRPHPDDVKLYPDNYTLWRYDGTVWPAEDDATDVKPRSRWIPYHRLTPREQRLVQGSLGPAICNILRTRWPTATLDSLEPARPFPVV